MQQPNRKPEPSHLTPVEKAPISQPEISDRALLLRFLDNYRKTGRCQSLPQLAEIARLAHQRKLTPPKQARVLLADLDEIKSSLPALFARLSVLVLVFGDNIQKGQQPDAEARFELLDQLTKTVESVERLAAIARNHPDAPEPGVEEGVASSYVDLQKRVNDLRYGLNYLRESLRPQSLQHRLHRCPNPDLQLTTLAAAIDDLYIVAMMLIPRLRENIIRQVPQFWGRVDP